MIHVEEAVARGKKGLAATLGQVSGEFSYEETAYHLPVTYALTGMAVHSGDTAQKAYAMTAENPLVAGECVIASVTARGGSEAPPYSGFVPDA